MSPDVEEARGDAAALVTAVFAEDAALLAEVAEAMENPESTAVFLAGAVAAAFDRLAFEAAEQMGEPFSGSLMWQAWLLKREVTG